MAQKACPGVKTSTRSMGLSLLDLPDAILYRIVRFMDREAKHHFFCASKGSQEDPGCALLVLKACKTKCRYRLYDCLSPASARTRAFLLHWAAHTSTNVDLSLTTNGQSLVQALQQLLVFPDARATRSGQARGKPATYPGITSLTIEECQASPLIPELMTAAFPNLKSLEFRRCEAGTAQPLLPVKQQDLPGIEHLKLCAVTIAAPSPVKLHIAKQLSRLTCLTSLEVCDEAMQAVPASALRNLKQLKINLPTFGALAQPTTGLVPMTQLESLTVDGEIDPVPAWVYSFVPYVHSIRTLDACMHLDDETMQALLSMPNLTDITLFNLEHLSHDYSDAECKWESLEFGLACTSHITSLPLHSLKYPVGCQFFRLCSADLEDLQDAKPHLLRFGGIMCTEFWGLRVEIYSACSLHVTQEEATELLEEWAPCLERVIGVACTKERTKALYEAAVARVWPEAVLWEGWVEI